MLQPDRVLGAVLAGGTSSRFGSDKAIAALRGRSLLEHARDLLAGVVDDVVIVGRDGGVHDLPAAGLGPLGGIAGALDHGARHGFASVLTIACDMPAVPRDLLASLLSLLPSYCCNVPVLGHWPTTLTAELLGRLAASPQTWASANPQADGRAVPWMPARAGHDGGVRARSGDLSVRRWADDIRARPVPSPVPLPNINTPADLAAL